MPSEQALPSPHVPHVPPQPSAPQTLPEWNKEAGGIVLEGDVGELVDKVIAILKEKTAVLR